MESDGDLSDASSEPDPEMLRRERDDLYAEEDLFGEADMVAPDDENTMECSPQGGGKRKRTLRVLRKNNEDDLKKRRKTDEKDSEHRQTTADDQDAPNDKTGNECEDHRWHKRHRRRYHRWQWREYRTPRDTQYQCWKTGWYQQKRRDRSARRARRALMFAKENDNTVAHDELQRPVRAQPIPGPTLQACRGVEARQNPAPIIETPRMCMQPIATMPHDVEARQNPAPIIETPRMCMPPIATMPHDIGPPSRLSCSSSSSSRSYASMRHWSTWWGYLVWGSASHGYCDANVSEGHFPVVSKFEDLDSSVSRVFLKEKWCT